MIRAPRVLTVLGLLALAGAALAQSPGGGRGRKGQGGGGYADPSGVIAAEIALGQLSVAKGQWAALAKMAAKDAILFTPDPAFAERWLKARKDAAVSVRWATEKVYMACDGQVALSQGHYTRSDGTGGWYGKIWRRDPKAGFQWILDYRGPSVAGPAAHGPDEGDEIDAKVAFCKRRAPGPELAKGKPPVDVRPMLDPHQSAPADWEDRSPDGSLRWRWAVGSGKSRTLDVWMATDTGETQVMRGTAPPAAP